MTPQTPAATRSMTSTCRISCYEQFQSARPQEVAHDKDDDEGKFVFGRSDGREHCLPAGRWSNEVQVREFLTVDDAAYTAAISTDLFKRRLDFLTTKISRKVKLPKTPDEWLAFAKRSLVKLSKTADI